MHIDRMILRKLIGTIGILSMILFSIACAPFVVKQNYYLNQNKKIPTLSYGGYEIRLDIWEAETDKKSGYGIYGFFMEAIYSNKIKDTMLMDTIRNIEIDSLCIESMPDSSYCLVEAWSQGPWLDGKILYGKQIAWRATNIPERCDSIRVNYVIKLKGRLNNSIIESKTIQCTLYRFKKVRLDISR